MTKRNKIIYWIATGWLALGMISTGLVQLFKAHEGPAGSDSILHLGYPLYLVPALGVSKILGVIIVLMPGLLLLKEWAYAGFFFLTSGAIFSHIASDDPASAIFPSLLLLVLTGISWYCRPHNRKSVSVNFSK